MRRISYSFLINLFFCQAIVFAQMTGGDSSNASQWQLSFDVIKSQAQSLSEKNIKLIAEYNTLIKQEGDQQLQIRDWQMKNEELKQILKERHGRSDQQMRIEELTNQINSKQQDIVRQQKAVALLQKQEVQIEHILHLKKLKISDLELHQRQESLKVKTQKAVQEQSSLSVNQQELVQLQQKLQGEKDKETDLVKQLNDLKQSPVITSDSTAKTDQEIRSLELKVQDLSLEKEGLQNKNNVDNDPIKLSQVQELFVKKKELEEKIKLYEVQLNQLKNPVAFGLFSEGQKKQNLQQMVALDGRNIKLRKRISDLREDILLLRDQVNRLERKVNVIRGAEIKKK